MRLDGKITHGMVMDVESVGADNISFVFGPVGSYIDPSIYYTKEEIDAMLANVGVQSDWNVTDTSSKAYIKHKPTIPAAPVQSDWNESDSTSLAYIKNKPGPTSQVQSDWSQNDSTAVDYIKNKPTNVSAFTNDAGYLNNNFCPIIEDTRSSAVAAITGVAPFSTLVNGQRILLHLKYKNAYNPTLTLTLSGGTDTNAIPIKLVNYSSIQIISPNWLQKDAFYTLIYDQTNTRWLTMVDKDTVYPNLAQSQIDTGTDNYPRVLNAKLIHDNAYIVELSYSSGSLKANKMYDFGTVSSALTIPDLSTTDLVSNALNFYALRFIAGADNLSITFPTGVIVDDEPTINTGDYVEIMINKYGINYYASIKVWQAQ